MFHHRATLVQCDLLPLLTWLFKSFCVCVAAIRTSGEQTKARKIVWRTSLQNLALPERVHRNCFSVWWCKFTITIKLQVKASLGKSPRWIPFSGFQMKNKCFFLTDFLVSSRSELSYCKAINQCFSLIATGGFKYPRRFDLLFGEFFRNSNIDFLLHFMPGDPSFRVKCLTAKAF